MKIKDSETALANGTPVAVTNHARTNYLPHCREAVIEGLRQTREVRNHPGYSWGYHKVSDGILVRFTDDTTKVVGPAYVLCTWAEYQARKQAGKDREAALVAAKQRKADERAELADALGVTLDPYFSRFSAGDADPFKVVISIADLKRLAGRA